MIIGSCGYGATGSSVLTDLLSEYDNVQLFDSFEFVVAYRVDGLQDLEYHLMKQYAKCASGDYAIKRFRDWTSCYRTPFINKPCNGVTFQKISKDIEQELPEFLFPFENYPDVKFNGKPFYGASRNSIESK